MKKTCYNCVHYHGCLSEESPSQYHIHDYCDKFNMVLMNNFESEVNHFLDLHWRTMHEATADSNYSVNDDFETGEAVCWMFDETANEPFWPDERFESNKKHNRELAIKTLEYMFDKDEVWDEFGEYAHYKLDDYYDEDEISYYRDLLKRLKEIK